MEVLFVILLEWLDYIYMLVFVRCRVLVVLMIVWYGVLWL